MERFPNTSASPSFDANLASAASPPTHRFQPKAGYDLVAASYDSWHWTKVWRKNELPIIFRWLHALSPGRLLNVGCGTGNYASCIRRCGHRAFGIDISFNMLQASRRKSEQLCSSCETQADAQHLPFSGAAFD